MEIVRGRSVLKRTAVGRLQYYEKEEPSVVRRQVEDTERELSRYERALEQAEKELEALYERALGEAGADSAAVFMGHRMLLKDEENIREVIAFPMNSNAQDMLLGAPNYVSELQLRETHIKLRRPVEHK